MNVTVTEIHWISVSEQFPDDDKTVMIFTPGADQDVFIGWRAEGLWFDSYEGGIPVMAKVTAWAELPEGPK